MSADIAFDLKSNQYALFLADKPAWHHLGQVVKGARSMAEARQLAHLDYQLEKQVLYQRRGEDFAEVPAWGIFRADNNQFVAPVGANYQIIQNDKMFEIVDVLLGAVDGAHYESAGALGRGERVWVLARIPHDITIPGTDDISRMYLLFLNSHDRSSRARIKLVAMRVVCKNTIAIALNENGEEVWISHTAQFEQKLKKARELMVGAVKGVEEMRQKLHELASREMTVESLRAALDRIYPKIEDAMSESAITRRERVLDDILRLYEHNDGNMFPSIRNTGLNLLNAVVEHTDHYRGTRITARREGYTTDQARAESALFGTGEQLKRQALEVIMQTTSNNTRRDITQTYVTAPAPTRVSAQNISAKAMVVPEINGLLGQVVDATPEVKF